MTRTTWPLLAACLATAAECFVDNKYAFTLRILDHQEGKLSLHARKGEAALKRVSLHTME